MTELLTSAQMRAIEQAAINSGEVTGLELMERAGKGVVEAIFEEWPELAKTDHCAVVLCGPGNNGGDGFVVARLLHEWGWEVEVFLYGDADKLPPDAKVNYQRWLALGEVAPLSRDAFDIYARDYPPSDIWVDALFGTGLTRPLENELLDIMTDINGQIRTTVEPCDPRIVAVDIATGICADSGRALIDNTRITGIDIEDCILIPDLTISFQMFKRGHFLSLGAFLRCEGNPFYWHNSRIRSYDIGLNKARIEFILSQPTDSSVRLTSDSSYSRVTFVSDVIHKYSHGHVLILSGPSTKTGAARLAARGALRLGAGLVTVGAPKDALAEHAAQLNAVMLAEVNGVKNFDDMVLSDDRVNAICVGPALGLAKNRGKLLEAVLKAERATVVDADALTLISQDNDLFDLLHDKCILTPHAGEFARVFPDIAEKLNATPTKGPAYSKVDATREAAKRAGCVVLFKGPDTVIAAPDGRCAINSAHYERSAPWLATAGSGDVLAGFITGLLARGFAPMQAAETAAWLHVECALKFGPGLIAEDIPEQLPEVFRDLGL